MEIVNNHEMKNRATLIGIQLKNENGVDNAVNIIEKILNCLIFHVVIKLNM